MRHLPTPSQARQKGFSSFDNVEAEFWFDNRHTLAKFVEFVAAGFAEASGHRRRGR